MSALSAIQNEMNNFKTGSSKNFTSFNFIRSTGIFSLLYKTIL